MRPLSLLGINAPTCDTDDVLHAWHRLGDWVLRKSLAHEVEIGYGLVGVGESGLPYCASIEQPEAVTRAEANELARISLRGGAYLRARFIGPVEDLGRRFEAMLEGLETAGNMRVDEERPLVSVFLDMKKLKSGGDVRSNLLVPVRVSEMSKSSGKAA